MDERGNSHEVEIVFEIPSQNNNCLSPWDEIMAIPGPIESMRGLLHCGARTIAETASRIKLA